jgi:hypothetical protein
MSESDTFDLGEALDAPKAVVKSAKVVKKASRVRKTVVKKESPSKTRRKKAADAATGVKKAVRRKKKAGSKSLDFSTVPAPADGYFAASKNYVVYSPFSNPADRVCDDVGFDIGSNHLGVTGLAGDPTKEDPKVVWEGLLNMPSKSAHDTSDLIDAALMQEPNLSWIRKARRHRIEQQVRFNPKARQIAGALRSCLRTYKMARRQTPDVQYVNAELKYGVAPIYCPEARDDPLRKVCITKTKNTSKRKQLGERDAIHLMRKRGDHRAIDFLENLRRSRGVDQVHDITDSYLIAAVQYEQDRGVKIRAGKGKKIKADEFE